MGNKPCSGYAIALLVIAILAILPAFGGSFINLSTLLVLAGAIWTMIANSNGNSASATTASWFTFACSLISLFVIVILSGIAISVVMNLPSNLQVTSPDAMRSPLNVEQNAVASDEMQLYNSQGESMDLPNPKNTVLTVLITILVINIILFSTLAILSAMSASCHTKVVK